MQINITKVENQTAGEMCWILWDKICDGHETTSHKTPIHAQDCGLNESFHEYFKKIMREQHGNNFLFSVCGD